MMHILDDHLIECAYWLSDPLSPVKASFVLDDDKRIVTIQTDTVPVAASSMSFEQFLNTPANVISDMVRDLYQQSSVRRVYGG